jgi:NTE family protein
MREQRAKLAVCRLLEQLPPDLSNGEDAEFLRTLVPKYGTTIVHLIYRRRPYEAATYDYEFSRISVEEHWKAGCGAVTETLRHPAWQNRRAEPGVVEVLDLAKPNASVKIADKKNVAAQGKDKQKQGARE